MKNGKNSSCKEELERVEEMGDIHKSSSKQTPLRKDAFELDDDDKIRKIEAHFRGIMETLGLDLDDDSLRGTPYRVAKMYVKEIFSGLKPENQPRMTKFQNVYDYGQMLVEKNINVFSTCEHHFVPIVGKAHIAYFPGDKVIGLSKFHRVVKYFSQRPQVQERLTNQIADFLMAILETEDVAVVIDAHHFCISSRGIEDVGSSTVTTSYNGKFCEAEVKTELLAHLQLNAKLEE